MKDFVKYQHIERLGTDDVAGIEIGECYVFPKIDGSNGSIWFDEKLCFGSRNRVLSLDYDNQGFMAEMSKDNRIKAFFNDYPNVRLFGEWLIPHTLKTYYDSAWREFYVFDVVQEDGENYRYIPYEDYKLMLEPYNISFIPPICKITNPTYERLVELLMKNTYLIKDGQGVGEGIVIKNYNYKNKYGRVTWAKIVRNEFKANHCSNKTTEVKEKKIVEEAICSKYITLSLVDKEIEKIRNEAGWSSRQIPRLLNTIFYCLVTEECWNFVKEHKNPVIDFGRLQYFAFDAVKKIKPEIF
jgi:hypothetical protein